jgi:hypothetical protein
MCASPISASDRDCDPINRLWRISRLPGARHPGMPQDASSLAGTLERAATAAVAGHLAARCHLARTEHGAAREAASSALAGWDRVEAEIAAIEPELVARAHAFHARLASRHQLAYRAFARKQLLDLAACARLKTEGILAAVAATADDPLSGAAGLDGISRSWRKALPVRLPGLRAIECAAAAWYAVGGDIVRAEELAARAATVSGVLAAYPEEAPAHWPERPDQLTLLQFAFAAARLPEAVEAWSAGEEGLR